MATGTTFLINAIATPEREPCDFYTHAEGIVSARKTGKLWEVRCVECHDADMSPSPFPWKRHQLFEIHLVGIPSLLRSKICSSCRNPLIITFSTHDCQACKLTIKEAQKKGETISILKLQVNHHLREEGLESDQWLQPQLLTPEDEPPVATYLNSGFRRGLPGYEDVYPLPQMDVILEESSDSGTDVSTMSGNCSRSSSPSAGESDISTNSDDSEYSDTNDSLAYEADDECDIRIRL